MVTLHREIRTQQDKNQKEGYKKNYGIGIITFLN